MTADTETIHAPGKLGPHELVLLHGQPGSPADWLLLAGRLPAQLNAVAADRPGYGSSQQAAGGFAANARALLDDLGAERAALRRRWVASADDYGCALSILDRILHGPVATTHGEREGRPATAALASHRALSACGQGMDRAMLRHLTAGAPAACDQASRAPAAMGRGGDHRQRETLPAA